MLSCFPFSSYQALQEDTDYPPLDSVTGSRETTTAANAHAADDVVRARTPPPPPSRSATLRKDSSPPKLPVKGHKGSLFGRGSSKATEHLQEQLSLRKNSPAIDFGQRYTKLPTTTASRRRPPKPEPEPDLISLDPANLPITLSPSHPPPRPKCPHPGMSVVRDVAKLWPKDGGPSSSFVHKPARGWLHPDQQIADPERGVSYMVRVSGRAAPHCHCVLVRSFLAFVACAGSLALVPAPQRARSFAIVCPRTQDQQQVSLTT